MKVTLQIDNVMEQYYPQKTLSVVLKENALL